jgi:hypothetical protein
VGEVLARSKQMNMSIRARILRYFPALATQRKNIERLIKCYGFKGIKSTFPQRLLDL